MDSLTQIALGIAVAEVCAGKTLGNRTFLYGAVLGTLPDLDVLVGKFLNPVDGVMIHRGISHSLALFVVLAPLLGYLIARIERQRIRIFSAITMVFWCLFTHVALDMFTSWGTQLFWPLPDRIAFKTIFVVDPLYTIPLAVALVLVWRSKTNVLRRKYVWRGIAISSAYLALSCGIKIYALNQFENALQKQQISYDALIVKPTAFNLILWNANVATKEAYLLGDYSLLDSQPIHFKTYPKNKALAASLEGNPDFEKLKTISEGWYIVSGQNKSLYFNDLRFGLLNENPKHPQFAFSYEFVATETGVKAVEVPKAKRDGKALLQKIFRRMLGN